MDTIEALAWMRKEQNSNFATMSQKKNPTNGANVHLYACTQEYLLLKSIT